MNKISIGFIGYGNMAQAMAKGLIKENVVSPQNIYACARHYDNWFITQNSWVSWLVKVLLMSCGLLTWSSLPLSLIRLKRS